MHCEHENQETLVQQEKESNTKTLETYEKDKEVVEAHRETAVSY